MTTSNAVDRLTRQVADLPQTRRAALAALGGAVAAAASGWSGGRTGGPGRRATAQSATPAATSADTATGVTGDREAVDIDPATLRQIAQALWTPDATLAELPAAVQAALRNPQTGNAAGGQRMRAYIQSLLDAPESFTPDYTSQYETLLAYGESLSPHQAYVYTGFLGADDTRGFDELSAPANLQFPAAHGMHLGIQVEWYFLVGSAWDTAGAEYGVELMFFRYALLPPAVAASFGLTPTENQVVELQLAISRAGGEHYITRRRRWSSPAPPACSRSPRTPSAPASARTASRN